MEFVLAEKPTIMLLEGLGYQFIASTEHASLRDGENQVLFRPPLVDALKRINSLSDADANAAFADLSSLTDNQAWLKVLRGDFSRKVQGQDTQKTIRVVDFLNPTNNQFTVTSQFRVKAETTRIPDLVIHLNGIPVVVIEAKSPVSFKDKNGEAFDQIKQYEREIPRLFYSNCFNILTDGTNCLYGATGSPAKFYGTWRDPYPKKVSDFPDEFAKGLWSLLEPSRLLDLIAHFIVFESTSGESGPKLVKKICRYQQFRAVNKIVDRILAGKDRRGLVWHTQGSGKSLTMAYAALKLKAHRTIESPELTNPNILVLTDRVDLHDQISSTFVACGLPNPVAAEKIDDLRAALNSGSNGQTILSTIFKFQGSRKPIPHSSNWIVMVDECHRTQERDLGAFLRATLPDARFFGFTGTPIKKSDRDTYKQFGVVGEGYLDKYGIDDAVADGATVPIYYTGRKTEWHIDEAKIDILFDQWFAALPDDELAALKKKGVSLAMLVKHPKRIELIAYDIWTHFKEYAQPDGFKAQIVAYDREAVILFKRALDKAITEDLTSGGMSQEEAEQTASSMSACVYSASQEDAKPSEESRVESIRKDLSHYYLDQDAETVTKSNFGKRGVAPQFLIVCDKLLTGFDAPLESVMYLDKPLKEHSLLQAIARTNRVADDKKRNGLIVDYIGVSNNLEDALASYRADDVKNAMCNFENLRNELRAAHAVVMQMLKGVKRSTGPIVKNGLRDEFLAFIDVLKTEDKWFEFKTKAQAFIAAYETVSPDPLVLEFREDLKWIATFLQYGTLKFEKKEAVSLASYSEKIREMVETHLNVTGISTSTKLRHLTDPDFWEEFDPEGKTENDLKDAAINKTSKLKKTVYERIKKSPHQYGKFSERLKELMDKLDKAQASLVDILKEADQLARDLQAEDRAFEGSGLSEGAYGVLQVLTALDEANASHELAIAVETLYTDPNTAPPLWQDKEGLRRELRQQVRSLANKHGFSDLKNVSEQVEEFALKHFQKA